MIVQGSATATPFNGVPNLVVGIVPPQNYLVAASTNIIGIVGSASWGPVNIPTIVGNTTQYASLFGPIIARKYDLGTPLFTANAQAASNFRCVRVTDGTDLAASGGVAGTAYSHFTIVSGGTAYPTNGTVVKDSNNVTVGTCTVGSGGVITAVTPTGNTSTAIAGSALTVSGTGGTGASITGNRISVTATGLYTGSLGNSIAIAFAVSSNGLGWKVTVAVPGSSIAPETFDNIVFSGVGPSVWTDIVNAINNGQSIARGPSQIVSFSSSATVGTPVLGFPPVILSGGLDGAAGVTATTLTGSDVSPRTGMYALRSQACSLAILSDCDSSTQWTNQVAFGLSEGIYMIGVGPAGDTISNAVTTKQAAGIYSYAYKEMFGDWIWWNDTSNNTIRLVSPQGFVAGLLSVIGPQNSSLNKPLNGVVGTQKSGLSAATNTTYALADLQALAAAGIDVICNPQVGGFYFGCRIGCNSAAPSAVGGDNYTGMTNFLAATLNSLTNGAVVGQVITMALLRQIESQQNNFLGGLLLGGQLVRNPLTGAIPWKVVCDATNNTPATIATGSVFCNTQVQYGAILTNFAINLEGGQTVVIATSSVSAV